MSVKRVGVIGGGQLAWMMAGAAKNLDIELVVQTPSLQDPATSIAAQVILGDIDDAQATTQLATCCDVITFENEFIDLKALKLLENQGVCFRPSLDALSPLLDKYHQRCYLQEIGLPVPSFLALDSGSTEPKFDQFGFPVVLKSRRHGYDGQGTFIFDNQDALETVWNRFQCPPMLLEEFVPFERELAVIAARSVTGECVIYPVVETQQEQQVCRRVLIPAEIGSDIQLQVEGIARKLLEKLQVVGIFGIELFLTETGRLLINEIAPRTHNSGHYSLDACQTSQFEMQLQAVSGLALGSPALKSAGAVMVNLLGYEHSHHDYAEKRAQIAQIPGTHVHWYGKIESRPGRKLGHVTVLLDKRGKSAKLRELSLQIARQVEGIWYG